MKKGSTVFLKSVLYLIGTAVLAVCAFVLPMGLQTDITGLYGPILLGLYIPAIPFYFALFHAHKLLTFIDTNTGFSPRSVAALKNIKHSAIAISTLFTAGMPYIFYVAENDDAPGVVAIALIIIFASIVIATFAAVLQKLVQNGLDIKSENDLTV